MHWPATIVGSSPIRETKIEYGVVVIISRFHRGDPNSIPGIRKDNLSEWFKETDLKSVGFARTGSNPVVVEKYNLRLLSSIGRVTASRAVGWRFDSVSDHNFTYKLYIAQLAESFYYPRKGRCYRFKTGYKDNFKLRIAQW
jgi:hypothetical protein